MDMTLCAIETEAASHARKMRAQKHSVRRAWVRKCLMLAGIISIFGGLSYAGGSSLMVPASQEVSQYLITHAWDRALRGHHEVRPWPWAETAPVARLSIPALRQEFVILRGVSQESLSLAPGWNEGTNFPGDPGISLISAYKDTYFKDLKKLNLGDLISLQARSGRMIDYRVETAMILDDPELQIKDAEGSSLLVLSTSYPYSKWQEGQDLRYVVVAREIPADHSLRLAGTIAVSTP
jgi:sortase A